MELSTTCIIINTGFMNGKTIRLWRKEISNLTHFPDRSVIWTNVSLNEAKIWATAKTSSPSLA